jgi:Flp pilus assembly pilin Flp
MGVIVGFVAVALVSAMYGIYSQVKVAEIFTFFGPLVSHF